MTVREALDMAGEETWIRVRPHGEIRWAKDVVLWSGNWRSDDYPMGLGKYLDWRAGDLSAEKHPDPLGRKYPGDGLVPMLVVCAYRRGFNEQANTYFNTACNMDPNNAEYRTAVNNMNNQRAYNYGGYTTNPNVNSTACSVCDICSAIMCADCLCSCCRSC